MSLIMTPAKPRKLTGRHVLFVLLGAFALVLATNTAFIYLALDSFTGTTSDRAYQEGLDYNQRLAAAAAQAERGWQGNAALEEGRLTVVASASEAPLTGLLLKAWLRDPTGPANDQTIDLTEVAPGRYDAPLTLPRKGQWDLLITGAASDGTPFILEQRLWVK